MPLCFWSTQTAVAPIDHCVGIGRLDLKPYLPPHTAATVIQRAYRSHYVDVSVAEMVWRMQLSGTQYELERNMTLAMRELRDPRYMTHGSVISSSLCHLDNG